MSSAKLCIVSGVSGLIGGSIAASLHRNGFAVVGVGRTRPTGWTHDFVGCDFTRIEAVANACEQIKNVYQQVWALINVAGRAVSGNLDSIEWQTFDHVLHVNTVAPALLARAVIPIMSNGGRIVSISSIVAEGKAGRGVYAASKAALNALSRTWALELGSVGVTSNVVSPGPVDTPMFRSVYAIGSTEEMELLAALPTGRLTTADEVSAVVLFLLSDAAANITGQNICVDGGHSSGVR